ncbi:TIGR02391 family protein [Haloferax sp. AS1]|uniref:TIGR02391 family protein n=1 Tax=Haloferax sp. AS1 TaxID=2562277 RepID=UPI0037443280
MPYLLTCSHRDSPCCQLETTNRQGRPDTGDFAQNTTGAKLDLQAFHSDGVKLSFGETEGEQDGAMFLYRGAFQALRNPVSHRSVENVDEDYARDAIYLINVSIQQLEELSSYDVGAT